MSVRCITQVLEKSKHSGTDLLMLLLLADYSDDNGRSFPAVATLARYCRMTPRNARYILNTLQASGELRVIKSGGPKGCNLYHINLEALAAAPDLKPVSSLKAGSPVKPNSSGGEAGFPEGVKPTSSEPSLNRQGTVNTRVRGTDTTDFEDLLADVDRELLADWLKVRKSKSATELTRTALEGINSAAQKVGLSLNNAIRLCVEKNWITLRAEYLADTTKNASGKAWEGAK